MAFFFNISVFVKLKTHSHCGNIILVNLKLVVYLSLHSRETKNIQKKIVHRAKDRKIIKMSL